MDECNLKKDQNADQMPEEQPVTSTDFERFFALNTALSNVDDIINSPDDKMNDFVKRIFNLFSDPDLLHKTEKIGIDFSSPNIAKPFHVGHLRSTFIGRALSNLAMSGGSDVVRINYLGDWGTQFGLLAIGYDKFRDGQLDDRRPNSKAHSESSSDRGRLRDYFDIYVKANELAEMDGKFRQRALEYFARLENENDEEALKFWRRVVEDSVSELKGIYARLNVHFDVYESEQAVASPTKNLLEDLKKRNVLERNESGVLGMCLGDNSIFVPLEKSDGTTLYLTRDIYTALRRFDQLSCRKLMYVTDKNQEVHFRQLKLALHKIGRSDVADSVVHVRFGRVRKMSTRKGQVIFVDDLLDEGVKRAEETILVPDPKTKTPAGTPERRLLAEQLSLSSLVIDNLRHRLLAEYDFDWNNVLNTATYSGIGLQKYFCRISGICQRCGHSSVDLETFQRSITEKGALQLMCHLTRNLEPALRESMGGLEFRPLVKYLFHLRQFSGVGIRHLRVFDAPTTALRSSRFMLFDVARKVLGLSLRLLGARPLAKI